MAKGYLVEIDDIVGYIDLKREKERSRRCEFMEGECMIVDANTYGKYTQ